MPTEAYTQTLAWAAGTVLFIGLACLLLGGTARAVVRLRGGGRMRADNAFAGYFFAAPWIVGFVIFVLGPMLISLYWSFTTYALPDPPVWVGPDNYARLLSGADRDFRSALFNTLYMTLLGLPLQLGVALGLAVLLSQRVRGQQLFRMAFYMPVVLAGNAAMLLSWRLMLNTNNGIINTLIREASRLFPPAGWLNRAAIFAVELTSNAFVSLETGSSAALVKAWQAGFPGPDRVPLWLQSPLWAKPSVVLLMMWGCGTMMMIYLAALYAIPREIEEAAEVDGASGWQRFRFITLPLISPATFYNLVVGIIATLQIFEAAYSLTTNGGPGRATYFVAYYLFRSTFRFNQIGYGAAMSWILFALILAITAVQFRAQRRWVQYDLR
jgi:multiple sugar transport system permease protein